MSTPTPETLRKLVDRWRRRAHELRYNPGAMPFSANRIDACADELAALLDTAREEKPDA